MPVRGGSIRRGGRTALAGVVLLLFVSDARSQAWLPAGGALALSMTYSNVLNLEHYLPDGGEVDVGHTRTDSYGFLVTYSPNDRVMLTAGLPYVRTRYWGERPHPTEVDNGHHHSTFTDLRLSVHYQWLEQPIALAPYVAVVTPVADYETMGHAAPGRGLNEAWVGFGIGKNLDAWLPRTYAQARVNYAFVEQVADIAHDRSNVDVEVGYFFTPRWSVAALGFWQFAHGGVDVPMPPTNPLFRYHDQLAAESFFNAGLGVSWLAAPTLSMYGNLLTSVRGENGHKLNQGVALGLSYRFSGAR